MGDIDVSTYKEKDLEAMKEFFDEYCESIKKKNRFTIEKKYIEYFDKIIENSKCIIKKGDILYRARINDKDNPTPYDKDNIGIPNPDKVKTIGRLNPYGINYLYTAINIETAIAEVRPNIDDYVSIGNFIVTKAITVLEFSNRAGASGTDGQTPTSMEILRFMMFLSQAFQAPIRNSEKELEYLPTQYFAEYCKSKGIEGIKFLSSVNKNGYNENFNITLFEDKYVNYIKTDVYKINSIMYRSEKVQLSN